jgi:hypothetical protein
MVFGHTLDGILTMEARGSAAVVAYWTVRGFTTPLFLMVSGWAAATAISRGRARGLEVPRGRIGRVILLLAVGYCLRWPGWGLDRLIAGDQEVWAHLLAFDALHTIAISLLAASLVFALPWRSREKAALFLVLAVLSVSLGMRPPTPLPVLPRDLPNSPALLALVQAVGGSSPFSLFPWSAYFFVGGALGLLLRPDRRSALWMAATGALLAISNLWTVVGEMPLGHPVLFLCRTGAVLLLLAALTLVPASIAARAGPLGRASLGVYAIHVPIVYGWSNQLGLVDRVGQRLSLPVSLAVAALVLAVSLTLLRGGQALWRSLSGALRRRRPLVGGKRGLPMSGPITRRTTSPRASTTPWPGSWFQRKQASSWRISSWRGSGPWLRSCVRRALIAPASWLPPCKPAPPLPSSSPGRGTPRTSWRRSRSRASDST